MQDIARRTWTGPETELWARIAAHPFERSDQSLDFTRRLARELNWSLAQARAAITEYRRFCFLAMAGGPPATPSEEVDAVWHLHLTYSRDYWDVWCAQVLRRSLHHDPTAGGPVEQGRYRDQYAGTLARYEAYFGLADAAFWPGTAARFRDAPRYRMIDRDRTFVLARPRFPRLWPLAVLALAMPALAPSPALAAANPLDWYGSDFLVLYAMAMVVGSALAYGLRERFRDPGPVGRAGNLGLIELAYLGGGPARVADLVAVALLSAGAASLDADRRRLVLHGGGTSLPPSLERFRPRVGGTVSRGRFTADVAGRLDATRSDLMARSLYPDASQRLRMALAVLVPVTALLAFGLAKVLVGLSRGRPVGFLVVLMLVAAVVGGVMLFYPVRRTTAGDEALAQQRARNARAARAPLDSELLFAFALGGASALAGTAFAAYLPYLKPSGRDGGDGGGSSGEGNGCGGCGGGD